MRKKINNAIAETIEDLLKNGIKPSFSERELKTLGVKIPEVAINAEDIQKIREITKLSQSVFAKVLNVSSSSVSQWEQGKRTPSGSTKVLLELLQKYPDLLNYRIESSSQSQQA